MIIPKKSLGQNFLIDDAVIKKILDISKIKNQNILEIGPGTGNLTTKILEREPKKLIVVEKDNRLVSLLNNNLGPKIKIINNDILDIDENLIDKEK